LTKEQLAAAIGGLLRDEEKREAMARAMRGLGSPSAAEKIVDCCLALIRGGR
jgi:UDP-N-acetylglucosamine:LPS N-acetylglucosamine transferase